MSVTRRDVAAIEARRRSALIRFGINPARLPLCVLQDLPDDAADEAVHAVSSPKVPPISDVAWNAIRDLFPQPHPNQRMSWQEVIDKLLTLAVSGCAWAKLGPESEAVRARLLRSRAETWVEMERRIVGVEIAADEKARLATLASFAKRYLAQRDSGLTKPAPTQTAANRLLCGG